MRIDRLCENSELMFGDSRCPVKFHVPHAVKPVPMAIPPDLKFVIVGKVGNPMVTVIYVC